MYHVRALSLADMDPIYHQHMKRDFPPEELRPFASMQSLYQAGRYQSYGLFDEAETLLGYACFARIRQSYLFDYLAILPDRRDSGMGSAFLSLLRDALQNAACIIGEVEDPDREEDLAAREQKARRMRFYLRAGYRQTGVRCRLFGVNYQILTASFLAPCSPEEIARLYGDLYRSWLPETVFQKKVEIFLPGPEDGAAAATLFRA